MQLLNNNPIYRLLIPKPLRTFFWKKFLRSKIINSYKDSNDEEIKEIILNIKKNGIQIISSTLSQEYDASKIKVYYEISGESYDNFLEKYGKDNYEWLSAKPRIPSTWSIEDGSSGGGGKSHHANLIFRGPCKDKESIIDNIKKFYEGFHHVIS